MKDIVFDIIEKMLRNSPERSYKRLNPSLRSALGDCINADLPFQQNTFRNIYNKLRGSWWFGDGAGSSVGEHFYTLACSVNHATAQQSFEHFAGRPACLWEENAKTPERLCVGSRFTWKGIYLDVTSMRKDRLVACSRTNSRREPTGLKVGATVCYHPSYLITSVKKDRHATILRVIPEPPESVDSSRRFTILYSEIAELRKTARKRLKAILDRIAKADSEDSTELTKAINAEHFRHFELEEIRAAFLKRRQSLTDAQKIEAWRKGENGAWFNVKGTLLRVRADRVECSNGNSVSRAAAARVLQILMDRRGATELASIPLDSYRVERIDPKYVTIGCTAVPWSEIDLVSKEIMPSSECGS